MTQLAAPAPADDVRRHLLTGAGALSIAVVALAVAAQVVVPHGLRQYQVAVLAAGLLLGLPHGSTDHLLAYRAAGAWPAWVLVPAYGSVAAAGFVAFRAWPLPATAVFIAVSGWHFATGETYFAALRSARARGSDGVDALAGLSWAAVVLVLPAAAHTADLRASVTAVMGGATTADGVLDTVARLHRPLLVLVAVTVAAAETLLARQRRWLDAAELAVLTVMFAVVAPLAAFGVYFGGWHALRHVARLLIEQPGDTGDQVGRRLADFTRNAAVPTIASLAVIGLLRWRTDSWTAFLADDLAVLAGLTIPHMLVIAATERSGSVACTPSHPHLVQPDAMRSRK